MPSVSVIVCSHNRALMLERTLQAIGRVSVPPGWSGELIIVDSASTDDTARVGKSARLPNLTIRYLYEGKKGLGVARNTGIAASSGETILFTDDDVVPTVDWLERMATPLVQGQWDAVVGRIELAEHLERAWMSQMHKDWLATLDRSVQETSELIGANMGFRRAVLERVPAFDPELGPGALGFYDDTLFSWQLREAGFRVGSIPGAVVVHHPEASRLLRSHWLEAARNRGRSVAYVLHHWQHGAVKFPLIRMWYLAAKLHLRRLVQRPPPLDAEGAAAWETSYILHIERCRQFVVESKRPRNYSKRGLIKRGLRP